MPERINGGAALAAIGAIALLVSLFLDWYKPELTAWAVFEVLDLMLAAVSLAVIGTAIAQAAGAEAIPQLRDNALPVAGVAVLVIVVAAVIDHPPAAIDRGEDTGSWVALAGAVLMAAGGLLTRAQVSLVITSRSPDAGASPSPAASRVRATREPRPSEEAPSSAARTEPLPGDDPFADEPPPRGRRRR